MERPAVFVAVILAAGTAPAVAVTLATAVPAPKTVEVRIVGDEFDPVAVTVARGDTVRWVNRDLIEHTVRHDSVAELRSPEMLPGAEYRWVARTPGRVRYYCSLHRGMRGEVTVLRR